MGRMNRCVKNYTKTSEAERGDGPVKYVKGEIQDPRWRTFRIRSVAGKKCQLTTKVEKAQ